jgi:hypothetical protein
LARGKIFLICALLASPPLLALPKFVEKMIPFNSLDHPTGTQACASALAALEIHARQLAAEGGRDDLVFNRRNEAVSILRHYRDDILKNAKDRFGIYKPTWPIAPANRGLHKAMRQELEQLLEDEQKNFDPEAELVATKLMTLNESEIRVFLEQFDVYFAATDPRIAKLKEEAFRPGRFAHYTWALSAGVLLCSLGFADSTLAGLTKFVGGYVFGWSAVKYWQTAPFYSHVQEGERLKFFLDLLRAKINAPAGAEKDWIYLRTHKFSLSRHISKDLTDGIFDKESISNFDAYWLGDKRAIQVSAEIPETIEKMREEISTFYDKIIPDREVAFTFLFQRDEQGKPQLVIATQHYRPPPNLPRSKPKKKTQEETEKAPSWVPGLAGAAPVGSR